MKPQLDVRIPAAQLPIDRRHRRAFSQMQFLNQVGQRLRAVLGREIRVRTSEDARFTIDRTERVVISIHEIETIDAAVSDALGTPETWRANAKWEVTWGARPEIGPDVRRGLAVWDGDDLEFAIHVVVEGAVVCVGLRPVTRATVKWYRCVTPFARPNDYAVDEVIERACRAWLPIPHTAHENL